MVYVNSHTVSGNLGGDPTLRDAGSTKVLSFSMVNESPFGNKPKTWYQVSIFGKQAETLATMLRKGISVLVIGGETHLEEWTDKDGNKRKDGKIRNGQVQILTPKGAANDDGFGADDTSNDSGSDDGIF